MTASLPLALLVDFLFIITEPKFILGTALLAVVTGGLIAAHVVPNDRLSNHEQKNCTVYLQEFQAINTLDGKRAQLSKAINCLDLIQYPQKQDYLNLKDMKAQLNSHLSVDEALQIFQNVREQKLDQSYISRVTAHPIQHYSWLLFQYLGIAIAVTWGCRHIADTECKVRLKPLSGKCFDDRWLVTKKFNFRSNFKPF